MLLKFAEINVTKPKNKVIKRGWKSGRQTWDAKKRGNKILFLFHHRLILRAIRSLFLEKKRQKGKKLDFARKWEEKSFNKFNDLKKRIQSKNKPGLPRAISFPRCLSF